MEQVRRALADESRRTLLETLAAGPATAGELAALLPIARPGVSRHLRVLREAGRVEVRQAARRGFYGLRPEPLAEVDEWLGRYRALWEQRLDALHTEIARGKRKRRSSGGHGFWAVCDRPTARASCDWRIAMTPTWTTCGRRSSSRTGSRAGSREGAAAPRPGGPSAPASTPGG